MEIACERRWHVELGEVDREALRTGCVCGCVCVYVGVGMCVLVCVGVGVCAVSYTHLTLPTIYSV